MTDEPVRFDAIAARDAAADAPTRYLCACGHAKALHHLGTGLCLKPGCHCTTFTVLAVGSL